MKAAVSKTVSHLIGTGVQIPPSPFISQVLLKSSFSPLIIMKFIADAMLGKLAKWLRILGCDVLYFPGIYDEELIEIAVKEKRIILTRDTLLIKRKKARSISFFVEDNDYKKQLQQVIRAFSLDKEKYVLTRCIVCNHTLSYRDKKDVKDKVPSYVYQTQHSFGFCPYCCKIYWPATHKDKIIDKLNSLYR